MNYKPKEFKFPTVKVKNHNLRFFKTHFIHLIISSSAIGIQIMLYLNGILAMILLILNLAADFSVKNNSMVIMV